MLEFFVQLFALVSFVIGLGLLAWVVSAVILFPAEEEGHPDTLDTERSDGRNL